MPPPHAEKKEPVLFLFLEDEMAARCFIAIVTGQNIANVAPLLATATPQDTIIFIETAHAKSRQWTAPAVEVLQRHGLTKVKRLPIGSDEPAQLFHVAHAYRWPSGQRIIVGNGGTKLQSQALYEALRESRPAILYSLDRPCVLQWYDKGPSATAREEPYRKTPLRLEDVLHLRGMRLNQPAVQLWQNQALTDAGHCAAAVSHGYGFDRDETLRQHNEQARWAVESELSSHPLPLPRWNDLAPLVPDKVRDKFLRAFSVCMRLNPSKITQSDIKRAGDLFNAAIALAERTLAASRKGPPPTSVGATFEDALVARLCRVLADPHAPTEAIHAVYRNVRVDSPHAPGITQLEADVLILFKNGLLVALEAKSHTAETKDLDARLLNLQRAGSQLACIVVVSPLYTHAVGQPWFSTHHEFAQRVRQHGLLHLALTLPNQPTRYRLPNLKQDETQRYYEYEVEGFEDACRKLLEPFSQSAKS